MKKITKPRIIWLVLIAGAVAGGLILLQMLWLSGAFLPGWILWQDRAGGMEQENLRYELRGRRFYLYRDGREIYASPREWCVQDVLVDDINGDDFEEIVMLAWRRGNYGNHRPTWVEKNDTSFSQHLFVFRLRGETDDVPEDAPALQSLWMSSALGFQVRTMEPGGEIPGTGRPAILLTEPDGLRSRWGWLTWGFMLLE